MIQWMLTRLNHQASQIIKGPSNGFALVIRKQPERHIHMWTCGVLHSIGSDLTRMRIRPNSQEYSPNRSEQVTSKRRMETLPQAGLRRKYRYHHSQVQSSLW